MDTSDLKAALRVAQSACQTAEKEAVYAQHRNDGDIDAGEVENAAAAEYNIATALSLLDTALRYCDGKAES